MAHLGRYFFAALLLLVLGSGALRWVSSTPPNRRAPEPPLLIGIIAPLTGSKASLGQEAVNGALLALEEVNTGAGQKIALLVEDSQGEPLRGVSAYKKLQGRSAKLIITQNSNVSVPLEPLFNADQIIQLAMSTTSQNFATADDYTFRVNGDAEEEARYLAAYIADQLGKTGARLAVVSQEDEYPQSLRRSVLAILRAKNI